MFPMSETGKGFCLLTFPGVILHQIAYQIVCDLLNVPVHEVCYFDFDKATGYVRHQKVASISKSMLIAIAPLIINSLVCTALMTPFVFYFCELGISYFTNINSLLLIILAWIGGSAGSHAFPSNQGMDNFVEVTRQAKNKSVLYLVALPLTYLLRCLNFLSRFWLDYFYALAIGIIPALIVIYKFL